MASILVFIEVVDGVVAEIGYELVDLARRIGPDREVVAFVAGPESALDELGAVDHAIWLRSGHEYEPDVLARGLASAVAEVSPDLVLVGSTAVGLDVATYAAATNGYAQVAYVNELWPQGDGWQATSLILGGKMIARVPVGARTLLQVLAGSGDGSRGRQPGRPGTVREAAAAGSHGAAFVAFEQPQGGDVDIAKEDILVSVGRGIGDAENIALAEDLAAALGGVVCSSRPVVDAGWLPKTRQVGKSGRKVRPKLYLALGISGAPEHLEGMRDAECIIAVNTDPKAPIFDLAHYGLVEDALDLLPALTAQVTARKA